jgi:hypothetical protein
VFALSACFFQQAEDFYGNTLEEALAWRLVWLMAQELGVWPFVA